MKTTKSTKPTALSAALALVLTLGLGACSDDDADTPTEPAAQETTDDGGGVETTDDDGGAAADGGGGTGSEEDTDASATDSGEPVDVTAQALQAITAAEDASGGIAYEIDDQDDDGTWEVDVAVDDQSVEVVVDAAGTVVRTETDDLDEDDRAGLEAATISLAEAIERAVAEVGGHLDDAELEEEDGEHYWEVSLDGTDQGDDLEVMVSVTGEILGTDD